jgi:hypothetical protein
MMNFLTLTEEEKIAYEALPEKLREGWEVRTEERVFEDTKEHFTTRLSFVRLHDAKLHVFKEQLEKAKTPEEAVAIVQGMDLSQVRQADMAELFFALGPGPISILIGKLLKDAKEDADMEVISSLSLIRGALLKSLSTHFA